MRRVRPIGAPASASSKPFTAFTVKSYDVHTRLHRTARSRLIRVSRTTPDGASPAVQPSSEGDPAAASDEEAPQARERRAGGPEDRALYHCHCGFVFEAPVSTTVGCPHCGSAQAW